MLLLRVYHILIFSALSTALLTFKYHKSFYLVILLVISVVVEVFVNISHYIFGHSYFWIYTLYLPVEHYLIMQYLKTIQKPIFHKWSNVLMFLYLVLTSIIWIIEGGVNQFPTHLYNFHGVIVTIFSIQIILNMKVQNNSILKSMHFWVLGGFILFYPSMFSMNILHDQILQNDSEFLKTFRSIFMKVINYLLYIMIIIGFLCAKAMKPMSS